jgi:hypothetical protein
VKSITIGIVALIAVTLCGRTWGETESTNQAPPQLRLAVDLIDGSHLIGTPSIESVSLHTPYANMNIPLRQIVTLKMNEDHETALVDLQNGDRIRAVIDLAPLQLGTLFGNVTVGIQHLKDLRVITGGGALPAGEGTLAFGGVNWTPWRTMFEVQGDKLVSLPKARPGFNYGHGGHGRGATLMSNIGSDAWKNYSVEFEFCMRGVDPAFNPYSLPLNHRAGYITFHVADAKESWNESGKSAYTLSLSDKGSWSLGCHYDSYCHQASGWGNPQQVATRSLAKGTGLTLDPQEGNRFRVDILGNRIRVWVDGKQIADVSDEKMGASIGGQTLDHGGVGFQTPWECMIWIRNFSARPL